MRLFGSIMTFIKNIFSRDKKIVFKNNKAAFVVSFEDRNEESLVHEEPEINNDQVERKQVQSSIAKKTQNRTENTNTRVTNTNKRNTRLMSEDEKLDLYLERILDSQEKQNVNNKPKTKVKTLK